MSELDKNEVRCGSVLVESCAAPARLTRGARSASDLTLLLGALSGDELGCGGNGPLVGDVDGRQVGFGEDGAGSVAAHVLLFTRLLLTRRYDPFQSRSSLLSSSRRLNSQHSFHQRSPQSLL
ncbi:hypothetical protein PIB30_067945 [Stylosanthes scabra]|uniref:Uncharacterized protein n=1 Tax=Stylosanthes scabra TaxID=79078 RepID=A0ABU6WMI5_9FABA|nr:hypothetical protein [Stylosanthes scabra]